MKREIKFRAWDKKNGVWENCFIGMNGETLFDCQGGGLEDAPNLILMQFTGLRDKNGKEIYEGDILKHGDKVHGVYWHPEICHFCLTDFLRLPLGSFSVGHAEIIGNIWENPELISKKV